MVAPLIALTISINFKTQSSKPEFAIGSYISKLSGKTIEADTTAEHRTQPILG
jgi:hypothetical protein